MNNFGRQSLANGPASYVTGIGWEYLEVINESGNLLNLNFTGLGSIDFPAWHLGDIYIPQGYTGGLVVTPTNISNVDPSLWTSNVVSLNGYNAGEISQPRWQALTRVVNSGGGQVTTVGGIATTLVNTTSPFGSPIILVQAPLASGPAFAVSNSGLVQIGMGNSGVQMLELGYPTPLQLDAPPGLASGGHPQIFTDVNGVVNVSTNGPAHKVQFIGNTTTLFDMGNGAISLQNPGTVLNGGTNGTVTLHQDFIGTVKRLILEFDNFQTAGVTQSLALPVAFTDRVLWRTGNIGSSANNQGTQFMASGVAQTISVVTALASTGGTTTSVTTVYGNSFGSCLPFDTFRFQAGATAVMNGTLEVIGV